MPPTLQAGLSIFGTPNMNKPEPKSITIWFERMRQGNPDAAAKMWDHFFGKLVEYSRRQISRSNRRVTDEEDVAAGVMSALCSCADRGKLPTIESRDDLWRILLSWARHDIADRTRANKRLKRGSGKVRGNSVFGSQANGFDQIPSASMPAETIAELSEHWDYLLQQLPNSSLREVALRRMQGYSVQEIATHLDVSPRTVERKLELIRRRWTEET